ncbi:hypothetical protein [Agrobacterium vitis]|uniref:hypothetical protein n=1 Tax=Agrobacterium vitis TaxID=373 RepID=UPI003D27D68E
MTTETNRAVSFASHVKTMFSADQRQCMLGYLDLWSHPDVSANAENILNQVSNGSMPMDETGPWPNEWVSLFSRWMSEGCAP